MILIVAFHCTINIDILKGNVFEQIVLFVTGIWGVFGVDCFFIISFNFLYTSKFKMKKFINIIKQILFYTIPLLICTAFIICLKILSECNESNFIIDFITGKFGRHSILFFIDSIFVFYIFKSISINKSMVINKIASTTFGIYLFHENQLFSVRSYMYNWIVKYNNNYFLIFYFLEIFLIFVLGVIIDLIRQWIFKKIDSKKNKIVYNNKYKKIDNYINQLYD